jgi:hypothetical protein
MHFGPNPLGAISSVSSHIPATWPGAGDTGRHALGSPRPWLMPAEAGELPASVVTQQRSVSVAPVPSGAKSYRIELTDCSFPARRSLCSFEAGEGLLVRASVEHGQARLRASGSTGAALLETGFHRVPKLHGFSYQTALTPAQHSKLVKLHPLAWLATRLTGCAAPTSTAPVTRFASGDCKPGRPPSR